MRIQVYVSRSISIKDETKFHVEKSVGKYCVMKLSKARQGRSHGRRLVRFLGFVKGNTEAIKSYNKIST